MSEQEPGDPQGGGAPPPDKAPAPDSSPATKPSKEGGETVDAHVDAAALAAGPVSPDGFAGWGHDQKITDLEVGESTDHEPHTKLGQWRSTAICGNDITSSCLYVSALCALYAGPYAPIALALVAGVLYLFRGVYAEVVSALPLNGGAYNALLNTSTKFKASIAACLTILSYVATAVISANEAMHYAHNLLPGLNVFGATIALLGLFALLNVIGISESANVALGIFVFHMTTLTFLAVVAGITVVKDPSILSANWAHPPPGGLAKALFFGFSAALLGISGFESSANFIEEQEEGVFPKTLRNMWIAVAVFNPLLSVLALGVLPLASLTSHKADLLAEMGNISFGPLLQRWVSLDAVLVLSGAVLTSYVGVIGLTRRMALDRCLPQFLLTVNKWRRTNHWIIICFFLLCVAILIVSAGEIEMLAGVYTISFLSVMALFAIGNMLLKVKRGRLPRAFRASWPAVILALLAVITGLIGNILIDPEYVKTFAIFFSVAFGVVLLMFMRIVMLRGLLGVTQAVLDSLQLFSQKATAAIHGKIADINSLKVVFFTRGDSLANLNRAALYVLDNEQTSTLLVVHVYEDEEKIPPNLADELHILDRTYPQLRIDFLAVKGSFTPALVDKLSERLDVPKNYMFVGCPSDRFPHRLDSLGGVRLIV